MTNLFTIHPPFLFILRAGLDTDCPGSKLSVDWVHSGQAPDNASQTFKQLVSCVPIHAAAENLYPNTLTLREPFIALYYSPKLP